MGGYANFGQVALFQGIDFVGQSSDVREFKRSRLCDPTPLVFRESAYKGRQVGFMVLTIEPGHVPSLKRSHHREFKKATSRVSLETHTLNNLSVSGTRLIFQEKIIFEQREAGRDSYESLTQMDKDCNLKNGIGI
jgi:hypothetical protein